MQFSYALTAALGPNILQKKSGNSGRLIDRTYINVTNVFLHSQTLNAMGKVAELQK
jgi:hypothetical protein